MAFPVEQHDEVNPGLREDANIDAPSAPRPATAAPHFMASQQIRNAPIFSGHRDGKMSIDDWIRDMDYMLAAAPQPTALAISTIVRNLSGEARRLVLNIPPHEPVADPEGGRIGRGPPPFFRPIFVFFADFCYFRARHRGIWIPGPPPPFHRSWIRLCERTPECAFHELRQEYSDGGCHGDPMAEFYERMQRPNEGILCTIEERDYGVFPVEERDAKLNTNS